MELLFVSGSTNHFDKSHPDFYFNLEKSSGIPRPHSAKPWDRSKISPLRDRSARVSQPLCITVVYKARDTCMSMVAGEKKKAIFHLFIIVNIKQ